MRLSRVTTLMPPITALQKRAVLWPGWPRGRTSSRHQQVQRPQGGLVQGGKHDAGHHQNQVDVSQKGYPLILFQRSRAMMKISIPRTVV